MLETEEATELIELEATEALCDTELDTDEEAEEILLLAEEIEEPATSERLEAEDDAMEAILSMLPWEVPITELDAWSTMLLALALPTEMMLSILPCGVPMTFDDTDEAMLWADESTESTAP